MLIRKAKIWSLTIANASEDVEQQECSFIVYGNKYSIATLEDSFAVFVKLDISYHTSQQLWLLGIYPRELKTYIHTKSYTQMSIAVLFIIAKT